MLSNRDSFADALIDEISSYADSFREGEIVETIYLGGGTPSLMSLSSLSRIVGEIERCYPVRGRRGVDEYSAEITIEVNPDDATAEYMRGVASAGFNRVSIGMQSFNDSHLKWMNRRHNAAQASDAFYNARGAGLENISIDLIFGFEMLSHNEWRDNIITAIELSPEHISAYQLGVEPGTLLYKDYERGDYNSLPDRDSYEQYSLLQKMLGDAGYIQYEISSFCKPGMESRHNSSYWDFTPYLGFGPSAHSFDGEVRYSNPPSLKKYLATAESGEFSCRSDSRKIESHKSGSRKIESRKSGPRKIESHKSGSRKIESRNEKDRFNEYIMLSLRRVRGMKISASTNSLVSPVAGVNVVLGVGDSLVAGVGNYVVPEDFYHTVYQMITKGDLILEGDYIRIPPDKLFQSDRIIRELFV